MSEPELLKKIESVLFAIGKKVPLEEITRLVKEQDVAKVKEALEELQEKYSETDSSLIILNDGDEWKISVKEKFIPYIKNIVTETDLTKTIMETLAVIAYKAPVLQADVIKIRTNKAYDHLMELEKQGYISRIKQGRTKLIRLTQKFFDYFDIPPDQLKERFKSVAELEKAVEEKEKEVGDITTEYAARKTIAKEQEETFKAEQAERMQVLDKAIAETPEIDLVDEEGKPHELKQYDTLEQVEEDLPHPEKEHLGKLEVVDESAEIAKEEIQEAVDKVQAEDETEQGEAKEQKEKVEPSEVPEEAPTEEAAAEPPEPSAEPEEEPQEEPAPQAPAEEPSTPVVEEQAEPKEAPEEKPIEETQKEPAETETQEVEAVEEEGYDITKELPTEIKGERLFKKGIPPKVQAAIDSRAKELIGEKPVKEGEEEKPSEQPEAEPLEPSAESSNEPKEEPATNIVEQEQPTEEPKEEEKTDESQNEDKQ